MAQCGSCGAPIVFGLTEKGHWLPLDAERNPAGEWRLFGDTPRAVHVPAERRGELADQLYLPHWASCPQAAHYRGRR